MPDDLRMRCIEEINSNPDEFWYWSGPLSDEFRQWFRKFIDSANLDIWGEASLGVFNRKHGSFGYWHCDSAGGDIRYGRRVFCCVYMTDTFDNGGALRLIPGSHTSTAYDSMKQRLADFVEDQNAEVTNLHEIYPDLHPELCAHKDGEIILEIPAGTVVIADERIWHAVSRNKKSERRTMVMWWRWKPLS